MRIIGIDPGTRTVGWGIIDFDGHNIRPVDYGVIDAGAMTDYAARFAYIHEQLHRIILRNHPDIAAVEEVFTSKALKRSIEIGEGRGVALLSAAVAGVKVAEYSPAVVKKSVVGTGQAHKSQVQQMVRIILGLDEVPSPEDAADALAIAICHCHRHRLDGVI